jgi:hypothetical protein
MEGANANRESGPNWVAVSPPPRVTSSSNDGRHVGVVEHIRYEQHADYPDEIVVRRRNVLFRRRRAIPFDSVHAVDPSQRTVTLRIDSTRSIDPIHRRKVVTGGHRRRHVSREPRGERSRTMETLSPELIASLTVTGGLGFILVWMATRKGMIEERDSGRRRCAVV